MPGLVHMGFLVDKVALARVFLLLLRLFAVSVIPRMLHTAYNHRLYYVKVCYVTLCNLSNWKRC